MTWAEVREHLAVRFGADPIEIDGQTVDVVRAEVLGATWIQVKSAIGPARGASPTELLVGNLHLPIGAFCVEDGALALRQKLPLAAVRPRDLDEIIHAIATQSARVKAQLR